MKKRAARARKIAKAGRGCTIAIKPIKAAKRKKRNRAALKKIKPVVKTIKKMAR